MTKSSEDNELSEAQDALKAGETSSPEDTKQKTFDLNHVRSYYYSFFIHITILLSLRILPV